MFEFQLFRIKIFPTKQLSLFGEAKSRLEILKETIESTPSKELRRNTIWHIGNVQTLDENGIYFRIGRTISSKIELYKDGNFIEQEFESAPYTHIVLDIAYEICAIAKKPKISPGAHGIASQFAKLLNESEKAHHFDAAFEIDELSDPEDFISHLRKAYAVSKFWVGFSKPNAFDVNADFVKPMQNLLKNAKGHKGKTELKGENLDPKCLEDLARSAAATGDDASAEIRSTNKSRKTRKRLKGKSVVVQTEEFDDEVQKKNFLNRIRDLYHQIRGTQD